MVDGQIVNIPSYQMKPGEKISIRERSKDLEAMHTALSIKTGKFPWVEFDQNTMTGTFLMMPEREQIPENINEQLIVELYSK